MHTQNLFNLFKSIQLLKLEDIHRLHVGKFALSYIQNSLPLPLSNLFTLTHTIHNDETRHSTNYKMTIPKMRTVVASNSILLKCPQIWNNISQNLYIYRSNLVSLAGLSARFRRETLGAYID